MKRIIAAALCILTLFNCLNTVSYAKVNASAVQKIVNGSGMESNIKKKGVSVVISYNSSYDAISFIGYMEKPNYAYHFDYTLSAKTLKPMISNGITVDLYDGSLMDFNKIGTAETKQGAGKITASTQFKKIDGKFPDANIKDANKNLKKVLKQWNKLLKKTYGVSLMDLGFDSY